MNRLPISLLDPDPNSPFPSPELALREPDGLLAAGGDLSPTRLLNAYRHGIFPWFSQGQPILWWCPDPRMVFATQHVRLSTKFRRTLRHSDWTLRADTAFAQVIATCAKAPSRRHQGTWITDGMIAAYTQLHQLGHAHSIEVFAGEHLVGGIYGVAIGRMFFGESMFSTESGGSKVALAGLAKLLHGWGWPLIDAQVESEHLRFLGAQSMPRPRFLAEVANLTAENGQPGPWTEFMPDVPVAELGKAPA